MPEPKIYPPNLPGMPLVGADFIQAAQEVLNDTVSKKTGSGKKLNIVIGPILEDLIYRSLYSCGDVSIPVTVKANVKKILPIYSGHNYGTRTKNQLKITQSGPHPADVMVITKILNADEIKEERVLAGNAAILFEETLAKFGVTPEILDKFYITSVVKTINPEGKDSWRALWAKNFLHLLHQELRIVRPKIILCLGADSVKALFGNHMTLSKIEGTVAEYTYSLSANPEDKHTSLVVAALHPQTALAIPEQYDKFELGINQFSKLIRGVRFDQAEEGLDHRLIMDEATLDKTIDEALACGENNIIAMDCEWHGDHPQNKNAYLRTIQFSWAHKTAAAIILRHAGGAPAFKVYKRVFKDGKFYKSNKYTKDEKLVKQVVCKALKRLLKNNRACGHFFNADLEWLVHYGADLRPAFAAPPAWTDCKTKGGLDTALMAHAVDEVADFSLTAQAMMHTEAPRYDTPVLRWKEKYCAENKIKAKDLEGYGECPGEILYPYALYDADVTRRLAIVHSKNLDCDRFKNNCWEAFWISQKAVLGVLEMKLVGIPLDKNKVDELTNTFIQAKSRLYSEIVEWSNWPNINLSSVNHVKELLYGEKYNGKQFVDNKPVVLRPEGARSLFLEPILTTDKRPVRWADLTEEEKEKKSPSTNRSVLGTLFYTAKELQARNENNELYVGDFTKEISSIRNYRYISHALQSVLRMPNTDEENNIIYDDDDNWEYDAGIASYVCDDGRIRTTIYQDKETGRWASARPALQNISNRRETDYSRILGKDYKSPLRSILCAPPGYVLVDADYVGAELFGMAIMSGDKLMLEHAQKNQLPEDHPEFYDIHSNIAKLAFNLKCEPTKKGLNSIGLKHLRIIAKSVIFGVAYGRQAKAIALAAKEEGIEVTEQDAQKIVNAIFELYPGLKTLFKECRDRAVTRHPSKPAPRWLCGPFGRFRRFNDTNDLKLKGDIERQAQNFPNVIGELKWGEFRKNLLLAILSQDRVVILFKVQRLVIESHVDSNMTTSAPVNYSHDIV